MNIPVSEIFYSFQGEGIKTGLPTIFVRISGCNFVEHPCRWCDTPYAWSESNAMRRMDIKELRKEVNSCSTIKYRTNEICLTGGEPLSIKGIADFIYWIGKTCNLTVETNGSYPIWPSGCSWSLDIKCPSSGNAKYNVYENLGLLTRKDQVKFVIADREDFDFAKNVINSYLCLTNKIFQPVWGVLDEKELIEWVKNEVPTARIMLQQHKQVYGSEKRGV